MSILNFAVIHGEEDHSEIEYRHIVLRKGPADDSDEVRVDPTLSEISAVGEPANGFQRVRVVHNGISEEYYQSVA